MAWSESFLIPELVVVWICNASAFYSLYCPCSLCWGNCDEIFQIPLAHYWLELSTFFAAAVSLPHSCSWQSTATADSFYTIYQLCFFRWPGTECHCYAFCSSVAAHSTATASEAYCNLFYSGSFWLRAYVTDSHKSKSHHPRQAAPNYFTHLDHTSLMDVISCRHVASAFTMIVIHDWSLPSIN